MPRITTFSHMNLYIEINSCKMFAGNDKNVVRQEENQKKKVKMKNWQHLFFFNYFYKAKEVNYGQ